MTAWKKISFGLSVILMGWPCLSMGQTIRISVAIDGTEANADSYQARVSDDGSVIAYRSNANNLVANDTNGWSDIFVRDLIADSVEIASLQPDGNERTSYSMFPNISDDGQLVIYEGRGTASSPSNIAYPSLYDRSDGSVAELLPQRVPPGIPVGPNRARNEPSISGNGQYILFHTIDSLDTLFDSDAIPTNTDNLVGDDIYVFDIQASPIQPIQPVTRQNNGDAPRADSRSGSISDDGQFVAFYSYSDDLLATDDLNKRVDVFVRDRSNPASLNELISANSQGEPANDDSYDPVISGNGKFVVFRSAADDLVDDDMNRNWDIFVRDRMAQSTERVSISSDGTEADNHSFEPSISDDGRYVVFRSLASNLITSDTNSRGDIYVHDRELNRTARVSEGALGEADGNSWEPAISGDGRWVVFESDATNLVAGDTNRSRDIFRAPNPLFDNNRNAQVGDRHE